MSLLSDLKKQTNLRYSRISKGFRFIDDAMVTGIETAGLVLAVFPIIVEGLKVYLDGISSIKKYWQFIAVLKRLIRDLLVEEVKFSNTCTELLHDLVDSSELIRLLEKPGGERWRTTELQIKLKERLGRGLQAYMEAVIDMTDCLEDFRRKLELGPTNRVSPHTCSPAHNSDHASGSMAGSQGS